MSAKKSIKPANYISRNFTLQAEIHWLFIPSFVTIQLTGPFNRRENRNTNYDVIAV